MGPEFGAVACLLAGILSVGMGVYFYLEHKQVQDKVAVQQAKIAADQQQLKGLTPLATEVAQYQALAATLHKLFDNQVPWETVLQTVESRLYRRMTITTIQATGAGVITITGITPSYTDYAKIYASLTDVEAKKYFSSAKPTAVSKVGGGASPSVPENISFGFSLTLRPEFLKSAPAK